MATNLDHSTTSSQSNPLEEMPQTVRLTTPVASPPLTREDAKGRDQRDVPKTMVRMPVPLTNEDEGMGSLDDTAMRPAPYRSAVWGEQLRRPTREERPKASRIPIIALVCVVAAISFVAGGVVARLSSQMPVLLSQKSEATEVVASYTPDPVETVAEPEPEPEPDPVEQYEAPTQDQVVSDSPSYDDGYGTVDEGYRQDDLADERDTYQWNLDEDGNESITYDPYSNQVTIDYDGYSLSVPIGDLIDNSDDLYTFYSPNRTDDYSTREQTYDDSTSYNDTNSYRYENVWGTPPRMNGWS